MSTQPRPAERPDSLTLSLEITDPEVVEALFAAPEGRQRQELARTALRIGMLALQQARGRIDGDTLRNEGERLVVAVQERLAAHQKDVAEKVASNLKDYFDPESGRFNDRVKRLVSRDGELEQVLRRLVGQQDSELTKTLTAHVGESSLLMKALDPKAGDGLLSALSRAVEEQLRVQREHIVGEFSLDKSDSALCKLVAKLTERHGNLELSLKTRIDEVVGEFSLNKEGSALSVLVSKVSTAQEKITSEFSLDSENSALARMKRELEALLKAQADESRTFQSAVTSALEGMKQRKQAEARSTTHGHTFEAALSESLLSECRSAGDVFEATGLNTGLFRGSKKGDFVVTLSPDCKAAGAKIVLEAKESGSYSLKEALEELEEARKNRGAEIGVFCWSHASAPAGTPPLVRHGNDIVLVWDAQDPATDAYLRAGLSLARALCTRATMQRDKQAADLGGLEKSIRAIEKQAESLEEIRTSAGTIENGAKKILERVRIAQGELRKQVAQLDEILGDLKEA